MERCAMQTRPTHARPTTAKRAKAEFKRYGPRFSTQEARQLERNAELESRAASLKEKDRKKKEAKKRREEKEQREREARRRLNIPSQKPYVSQHQPLLTSFFGGKGAGLAKDAVDEKPADSHAEIGQEQLSQDALDANWIDGIQDEDLLVENEHEDRADDELVVDEELSTRPKRSNPAAWPTALFHQAKSTFAEALWQDQLPTDTQVTRDLEDCSPQTLSSPADASPANPHPNDLQQPRRPTQPHPAKQDASRPDPASLVYSTQDVALDEHDMQELGLAIDPGLGRLAGPRPACTHSPPSLAPDKLAPGPPSDTTPTDAMAAHDRDALLMPPPAPMPNRPLRIGQTSEERHAPAEVDTKGAPSSSSSFQAAAVDEFEFSLSTQDVCDVDFLYS